MFGDDRTHNGEPMDEQELKTILSNEISLALGSDGGKLSTDRRTNLEYYEGLPFGNEIEGRSQVVSFNVLEAVEWILPALLRIFLASDKIVEFEPYRLGEEPMADMATKYINYILTSDNNAFRIFYEWFKDAAIQKMGYVRAIWSEQKTYTTNSYTGLTDLEYHQITAGDDVEIISESAYPNPDPSYAWFTEDNPAPPSPPPQMNGATGASVPAPMPVSQLHDVVLRVWETEGRVKIENIAPESILVSRRAPTTALDGKHFVCVRELKRVTDLREMGFDEKLIEQAMGFDEHEFNSERVARFETEDDWPMTGDRTDPAMREIWTECSWITIDFDGDGYAELRYVVSAGNGQIIFVNELADDVPIVSLCMIPMPHKHIGMAVADLVMDLQLIKSTILRQSLDNLYLTNTPRTIVAESAMTDETFDDLLTSRPGGIVRVADIQGIESLTVPFVAGESMNILEYLDEIQEVRTGVARQNQTLNPDDLNKFASGQAISLAQNAAAQQTELKARFCAESIKRLAQVILGLVVRHQQAARIIRITGNWVPMDPRTWRESMDVNVDVALGTGNRDQLVQHLMSILQIQQQMVMVQKGVSGPLVTAPNIYDVVEKLTENLGFKQSFFSNPAATPPGAMPQQPSPEMIKAQGDIQANNARTQSDIALSHAKAQADMQLEQQRAEHQAQLEMIKMQSQMQMERMREQSKIEIEQIRMGAKVQQDQQALNASIAQDQQRLEMQANQATQGMGS
jgi:cell division septum initiation protein DivIVA